MRQIEGTEREAMQSVAMARAAEAIARGYAKPRDHDFEAGWRAGVEWAEEHGDASMVKWFVDGTREAEQSYVDAGLPIPKHPLAGSSK